MIVIHTPERYPSPTPLPLGGYEISINNTHVSCYPSTYAIETIYIYIYTYLHLIEIDLHIYIYIVYIGIYM